MNEDLVMEITNRVLQKLKVNKGIMVEASGKHVHLSKEHARKLFGDGYRFTKKKDLSQPGQTQYNEKVRLIGPKGVLNNVAILGPERNKTQVELSKTDSLILGVNPPVRESGDLEGSESILIASEKSIVEARESVIIAKRHIHMTPDDAKRYNVSDNDIVSVRVNGERPLIFEDVVVRVTENSCLKMHIDFDEENALGYSKDMIAKIITNNGHKDTGTEETVRIKNQEINKKLITEHDVRTSLNCGHKNLKVNKKSIITPLAYDFIKDNGISIEME